MASEGLPASVQPNVGLAQRWLGWGKPVTERLPLPYPLILAVLGVVLLATQLLLYAQRDPSGLYRQPVVLSRHLALPVFTFYMLIMLRTLKYRAVAALQDLRLAVKVSDDEYDRLVLATIKTTPWHAIVLLAIAAASTLLWFVVLQGALPFNALPQLGREYLSTSIPTALLTLISYSVFGWAGLELVVATIRFGRGLGALAEHPLVVNVFDPTNLLPFGTLALLHSISVAGVVVGLLILLGQPEFLLDYIVVLLGSLTSVLALVLPLVGVRKRMLQAKHEAVELIHHRLSDCQTTLLALKDHNPDAIKALTNATDNLISLRKTILAQPSWPFRNSLAVLRVTLTAFTPAAYFILNELIRAYLLPAVIAIK